MGSLCSWTREELSWRSSPFLAGELGHRLKIYHRLTRSSQLWPWGLLAIGSSRRSTRSTLQPGHRRRRSQSSQRPEALCVRMWTCCCFSSSESGSARQAWWVELWTRNIFGTFSCRQRPVAESSTLVSKTGITSSYVLRGFHAQYDHSFGALQVDE